MTRKSLRRRMTRPLVVVGAAMVVLVPGVAWALPTVTVFTPGATSQPLTTFSETPTDSGACAAGYVTGGGIDQTIGTGMSSNGNHVNGTEPSIDGSTEPLGGTPPVTNYTNSSNNDATHWMAIGGTGGMTNSSFSTTPYAVCLNSSVVTGTELIVSSIANTGVVMATCPSGTKLLGGGARATPASDGSMKPIASYPTYSTGHSGGLVAAGDKAANPDSWAAYGYFGSSPATYAFAICGTGNDLSGVSTKVRFVEASGPTAATTGQTETATCDPMDSDGTLLSGGAAISAGSVDSTGFALPGSQGDHLNGSYPSSSGSPAGNNTSAASWTAYTHTGGMTSSVPTYTDVWALCGSGL